MHLVFGVAVLALVYLAGCGAAESADSVGVGSKKVATFEGGSVSQAELQEQVEASLSRQGAAQQGATSRDVSPGSPQYKAMASQVLPQLVRLEIARAYAEEQGITVSDEDVSQEIEQIKSQLAERASQSGQDVSGEEALQQALEQQGLTMEELRQDIREGLPVQKVQERVVGDVEPSEQEVRSYYEENKQQFTIPAQRCARHILFNKDQQDQAEQVKQELQDGGDFAELAKEHSQDPQSAEQGGDLGCIGKGQTVPEFEKALFNAEKGKIVGPVETEFGYHLIEVTEIREEQTTPLEEMRQQISDQLSQQRQSEEFQAWLEEQVEQRDVQYLPEYDPQRPQTTPQQPSGERTAPPQTAPETPGTTPSTTPEPEGTSGQG